MVSHLVSSSQHALRQSASDCAWGSLKYLPACNPPFGDTLTCNQSFVSMVSKSVQTFTAFPGRKGKIIVLYILFKICSTTNYKTAELNESMVSFVSRCYMRVVSGRERLVVCLSEYLPLRSVYSLVIIVEGFVSRRDHELPWLFFKIMSFRATCCTRGKRHNNHEINLYVYPP